MACRFLGHVAVATSALGASPDIRAAPGLEAVSAAAERLLSGYSGAQGDGRQLLVALGSVPEARKLVPDAEVQALDVDEFVLRARNVTRRGTALTVVACSGRGVRAVGFALFELLQRLGFGFLHPLKPVMPEVLGPAWPEIVDVRQAPRWAVRGTHYHTQHPLELTNLLNGYDAAGGVADRERWAVALPAWEDFLDWMLAQKQTYVEWMLLGDRKANFSGAALARAFELSDERRERLRRLTAAVHARGLEVGADAPLVLRQQHALSLLASPSGRRREDAEAVRERVRWLLSCGFDHLGSELGTTEFSKGMRATDLVHLLNVTQEELGAGRRLFVKNHCSSKQHADGFPDPRAHKAGQPLNFNYLSYYADPKVVSMPHTVQAYSLADPAPTYGNRDFSDLRDWARHLLEAGRPMVFYPETAYWVNYDISVPLFLAPVYAANRVDDADALDAMPGRVLGQLNFESGWQWGFWLANSAQALTAWQAPSATAPRARLGEVFDRLLRFLPGGLRAPLCELLVDYAEAQRRLLIRGERKGGVQTPPGPGLGAGSATGIAYLQGSEGLSDIISILARYVHDGAPQPDRLHFSELWLDAPLRSLRLLRAAAGGREATEDWLLGGDRAVSARHRWFREHLRPLLAEMHETFSGLADRFLALPAAPELGTAAWEAVQDLAVPARLLALRCTQVLLLYDHAAGCPSPSPWCASRLSAAKAALRRAQALVPGREERYGLERLGGGGRRLVVEWGPPLPTAYSYGYLWAAHSLFYWRRDEAIVEQRLLHPCFAAINDPVELGLQGGGGPAARYAREAAQRFLAERAWQVNLSGCLGPTGEPPLLPPSCLTGATGLCGSEDQDEAEAASRVFQDRVRM